MSVPPRAWLAMPPRHSPLTRRCSRTWHATLRRNGNESAPTRSDKPSLRHPGEGRDLDLASGRTGEIPAPSTALQALRTGFAGMTVVVSIAVARGAPLPLCRNHVATRSEEHTSELQSLMRI